MDGIFEVCGVPEEKIRPISSAVDKLDKVNDGFICRQSVTSSLNGVIKLPWEDVKKEMTEEKGLPEEVADRIGEYVKLKGSRDLLEVLKKDEKLSKNANATQGLADMDLLFDYMDIFQITDKVCALLMAPMTIGY